MEYRLLLLLMGMITLLMSEGASQLAHAGDDTDPSTHKGEVGGMSPLMGGTGGVYLLPEPGELEIVVQKRDLNRTDRTTELRAILVGPDRQVLDEQRIADDGRSRGSGMGPAQELRLRADVEHRGVYALNITVSGDRYGEAAAWSFKTNSKRYLVETARGHRDAAHTEPIVLKNADESRDIWFRPRDGEFKVEAEDMPASAGALTVYDARDRVIETISVTDGAGSATIPSPEDREAVPWRLHLPEAEGTFHIDGVTRWASDDAYKDMALWTHDRNAWFALQPYRWLVTPYRQVTFGEPAESGELTFQVHNNAPGPRTIDLALVFPGQEWQAELSDASVTLESDQAKDVRVQYTIPQNDSPHVVHLRASPRQDPEFTTYSSVIVNIGEDPSRQPLEMPLALEPYAHQNEQFGYQPDYPTDWEMYVDLDNRPSVRTEEGVKTWRDGEWELATFSEAVDISDSRLEGPPVGISRSNTKIAYDAQNHMYLVETRIGQAVLLHSTDQGKTFKAHDIGEAGAFDIEQFSGHNVPDGPPVILRSIRTERDEELMWRTVNDLELIPVDKEDGEIVVGEPIMLSDQSLGTASHSGIPSAIVSRDSKVHVIWGEATDPDDDVPGVPTYVATYDRESGEMEGEPVLIGYGAPPNNTHNRPSITMDSEGYLHALTGTHGQPFQYARSLEPNNAYGGWTEAETLGEDMNQTYIGMVAGPDDTLHLMYRLWRYEEEPHPKSHHATLAYQRKPSGKPWQDPEILITPPFSEYSIFYHRLTIDRKGRLLLSHDYWSTFWFYRNDHFGNRRSTLISPDGGKTWRLLRMEDWED